MPTVSVIINCHNGEAYLREAIESVYQQTYQDWEIVLWDDASTDGSEQIARSFDDKLRYFKGSKALSLGQARNWAIEQARGEFIAILDQDDIWLPEKLELQLPLFERNSAVGLVFSDAIDYYESSQRQISHFLNLNITPPRGHIFNFLFVIDNYPVSMPTAVFRRKALDSLTEWFDIRYKYAEEYDLFLRIAHDWECDYVEKPLAIHRMHDKSSTKILHREIPMELNSIQEKILNLYPELERKLKKEIIKNKKAIDFQLAKSLLQSGNIKEARQILRKHIFNHKFFLIFIATLMPIAHPVKLYNAYHSIKRRYLLTSARNKTIQ